jgi:hypothetical protein
MPLGHADKEIERRGRNRAAVIYATSAVSYALRRILPKPVQQLGPICPADANFRKISQPKGQRHFPLTSNFTSILGRG